VGPRSTGSLRVVRIYHSAVVRAFRERDRLMRAAGVEETLITARAWNEGGASVSLERSADEVAWVVPARTFGHHPYRFAYNPLPLARALKRTKPHVLDVHEEPASLAVGQALLIRRLIAPQAQVVLYSAQNINKRYPPPFRWIERAALGTAKTIYCCSGEAAGVIRAKGFLGNTPVVPLGVDTDRFKVLADRRSDTPFRVGYVGRLEHHKGVDVLLEALEHLGDDEVVLDVVGAGSERESLERRAERSRSRVRFLDFVAHDAMPELLHTFAAVVLPSISTPSVREQFGRVAVEAMAAGVPVVASDAGALPEVVGDAGLIVPEGDAVALAHAIRTLAQDATLRDRLSAAGKERASAFAWDVVARTHAKLYEAACR
jgi:glycosyltransferase involved in cell wall biosynthesis